mmetsp:Transcript_64277/g.182294  ORF Transcript_64277/g.182294 Transcript_64277/m.182294 type:complete len:237 (-) Transcript_64277:528-1238(-)
MRLTMSRGSQSSTTGLRSKTSTNSAHCSESKTSSSRVFSRACIAVSAPGPSSPVFLAAVMSTSCAPWRRYTLAMPTSTSRSGFGEMIGADAGAGSRAGRAREEVELTWRGPTSGSSASSSSRESSCASSPSGPARAEARRKERITCPVLLQISSQVPLRLRMALGASTTSQETRRTDASSPPQQPTAGNHSLLDSLRSDLSSSTGSSSSTQPVKMPLARFRRKCTVEPGCTGLSRL